MDELIIDPERVAKVKLCGQEYPMVLTVRAVKAMAKRYGGFEKIEAAFDFKGDISRALDETGWLVTLLIGEGVAIANRQNPARQRTALSQDDIELMATPAQLIAMVSAVREAFTRGVAANAAVADAVPAAPAGGDTSKN